MKESFILFVCAAKFRLLKLEDADHEREVDQPNPPRAQQATYSSTKQVKKNVACVGLNSLCNMWGCIIVLKVSSRNSLEKGNDFRL